MPADASDLSIVGSAAYAAAYAYLWDDGAELSRQLATFSARSFEALLRRPDALLWVAELDGQIVGFLSMIVGSPNPVNQRPNGAEIPRIYLLPNVQGVGLGRRLLDSAINDARDRGLDHVWLDVMASASDARKAYLNWGFAELGSKLFGKPVKAGLADMVVLIRDLS
jgi:ribosomal protein S18 acetylase RimI-like enzyme